MDGRLHLAPVRRIATTRRRIVRAMNFDDLAFIVLHQARARNEVAVAQPNLASWRETEIFRRRHFTEVILLDVEHAREWNLAASSAFIFRFIYRIHLFVLVLRIIVDT